MAQKTIFETELTDIESTDVEGVGVLRRDELGNTYRWVKNRNATAFTAKQPVCYDAGNADGDGDLFESVNSPVTADLMLNAGIALTAIAASGGICYGWVQVEGICQNALVTTPATGGDDIEVGSELIAVNAQTYLTYQGNAGTAPIYANHFIALEVIATATGAAVATKDVLVKCL